jgi:folate-binding protein YgfZ
MTANMKLESEDATQNFSLLALTGKDGKRFLQGQLSCDMEQLKPGTMLRGALCNLKGRVIASMWLWQHDDVIYLRAGKGMATLLVNTLKKYMVFFDCQLTDISEHYQLWQTADGQESNNPKRIDKVVTQSDSFALCLDQTSRLGQRYEVFVKTGNRPEDIQDKLPSDMAPISATVWALADTETGWVMIDPALSEKYTPQLLNYDLDGTVNFKKGCYTGQEVIARMYYRAEAKQRLYRLRCPANAEMADYGISKADNLVFSAALGEAERIALVIATTDEGKRHPDIETIFQGQASAQ